MRSQAGGNYMLADAPYEEELARLCHLESAYGPRSRRLLSHLGVAPGFRCLEVGAGAGDVAVWLAQQVTPGGHVVATDIDTRFLRRLQCPNLEIRQHDICSDPLEPEHYDLVHCRLVLAHVRDTAAVLGRMVAALRRGGVLLVEEPIRAPLQADPGWAGAAEYERLLAAILGFLHGRGEDAAVGLRVPRILDTLGLTSIHGELTARAFLRPARDVPLLGPALRHIRRLLLEEGVLTGEELDAFVAMENDPRFSGLLYALLAVCARKPA